MALLDGFGVAPPEEHIIIVNETAEKINAYSYLTWGGGMRGGGWVLSSTLC